MFDALCKSIEHNVWFRVLIIAVTAWLLVSAYNKMQKCKFPTRMEGFAQSKPTNQNHAYEVGVILNKYPDISNDAVALDVGAGTGAYMSAFIQHGITDITDIETSAKMIAQAKKTYPKLGLKIVKGDPTTASAFEPDSFTLVSMMNFEVYYISNTEQLFANVYDWLKPGGYFVLHLVDPSKSSVLPNDEKTGFKMPSPQSFIEMATGVGFNMLGQIDLVKAQKEYQYFYLFHKPAN